MARRKINSKNVVGHLTGNVIPAGVGGVASLGINKVIPVDLKAKVNPALISGGKMLIGAALPLLAPKQKMLEPFAAGFIGQAAAELTAEMIPALVSGVDGIGNDDYEETIEEEYLFDEAMSGADDDVAADDVMSGTGSYDFDSDEDVW